MTQDLLFEIGIEEIPSGYLTPALKDLATQARRLFEEHRIAFTGVRTFGTPRRLTLHVERLDQNQGDLVREVVGPSRAAAFDQEGRPTKAALGFARGQGVPVEQLRVKTLDRGEYVVAAIVEQGARLDEILPVVLPRLITSLSFPKSMRWGQGAFRFVRPIRWLVALYSGRVIPFEIDGVISGNKTCGHRFLSRGQIRVRNFQDYIEKLEERYVIVNQHRRRELVTRLAKEAAAKVGGKPVFDDELVEMVASLVEYPTAVCGGFEQEYLSLPREVIMTPMRKHQRYFPVTDDAGKLLPYFVTISNMKAKDMGLIRAGNERVLRARLKDAAFFFTEDRRLELHERVPQLRGITFQERLGTMLEKVGRLTELTAYLAEQVAPHLAHDACQAAQLCKADLVTTMVKEFPSLQGVMGREYAQLSGEPAVVAQAIEEHYLPRFSGDRLPESLVGALVGIADRLDTICGCFGIGLIPTGSEDPYALRRHAQGIIQILLNAGIDLPLSQPIYKSLDLLSDRVTLPRERVAQEVMEFLAARLQAILMERGVPGDLVEAALSVDAERVSDAGKRAEALATFRREADFTELAAAFKRVIRILPKDFSKPVDPRRFVSSAERALHGEAATLRAETEPLMQSGDYVRALQLIAAIRPIVDMFFEEVLVMVEDRDLQDNRLAILKEVADLFCGIANFSKIMAS
ncbi:MAG: glycine--tRNA ligase subunit beta [Candidatus Methylomirabilis oxygeniifera]|uniref:Glycine--tRNA ligase beta subunit n=1 Tax=Methylomirabilis oxygeniifera TaxID=671143 RepID=D5MK96_METO1|nr:MAG: glycine--tRNA ligase subunit beta [Candidatus Methylomirabilis oxyfera]CBE69718.1 glycine tRNA synthetase, beta subunit [Candidatus Methylomirabilis oxyfera]